MQQDSQAHLNVERKEGVSIVAWHTKLDVAAVLENGVESLHINGKAYSLPGTNPSQYIVYLAGLSVTQARFAAKELAKCLKPV